jgi:thiamine kinase-like enzyme
MSNTNEESSCNPKDIDNPPNNVTCNGGFSIYPTPNECDTIKGIGYIKEELERILSSKLKKIVKIKEIIKIGTGYHSDGFKISTDDNSKFFLKRIKSQDVGFEFPERKIASLLVSHSMANRIKSKGNLNSIGVFVQNEKICSLPEINEKSEIYQLQEYGGEGKSYLEILNEKNEKKFVDEVDRLEIDKIIDYIIEIHKIKHLSNDKKILDAVYNDFLRNVIGHPEYILQLFHDIPGKNIVLSPEKQGEFLSLMIEYMHYLKNQSYRLRAIHGDFWGANVFFKEDGNIFVIDHSRMPWGDPGFDIGLFFGSFLVKYHSTKNPYFKELGDYFIQKYIDKTGDKKIFDNIIYTLGLIAVIYASPLHVPDISNEARKSVYEHTVKMLKEKRFFWPD